MGEKAGDYYLQVIDSNTGSLKTETLFETGEGSFGLGWSFASGEWFTATDTENRVLVYSLSSGELLWRFFETTRW
jgi:hypothetical protein